MVRLRSGKTYLDTEMHNKILINLLQNKNDFKDKKRYDKINNQLFGIQYCYDYCRKMFYFIGRQNRRKYVRDVNDVNDRMIWYRDNYIEQLILELIKMDKRDYTASIGLLKSKNIQSCMICMEDFKVGDEFNYCKPSSGVYHIYHSKCLNEAMKYQNKQECCYCKREFKEWELKERYIVKK